MQIIFILLTRVVARFRLIIFFKGFVKDSSAPLRPLGNNRSLDVKTLLTVEVAEAGEAENDVDYLSSYTSGFPSQRMPPCSWQIHGYFLLVGADTTVYW